MLVLRARRSATGPKVSIREMSGDDVQAVYELWASDVQSESPPPRQLDRWGPGVAVYTPPVARGDADSAYVLTPREPGQAVRALLSALIESDDAGGLVAAADGELLGFATYCVQTHPLQVGPVGAIDRITVRHGRDRHEVIDRLLCSAMAALREREIHVFHHEHSGSDRALLRVLRHRRWITRLSNYFYE